MEFFARRGSGGRLAVPDAGEPVAFPGYEACVAQRQISLADPQLAESDQRPDESNLRTTAVTPSLGFITQTLHSGSLWGIALERRTGRAYD